MGRTERRPAQFRAPARPHDPPRWKSGFRLTALWIALLLGSFLFGMLVLSPLYYAAVGAPPGEPPQPEVPARPAPAPQQTEPTPHAAPPVVREEREPRLESPPDIRVSPDEDTAPVQRPDALEEAPSTESGIGEPRPERMEEEPRESPPAERRRAVQRREETETPRRRTPPRDLSVQEGESSSGPAQPARPPVQSAEPVDP